MAISRTDDLKSLVAASVLKEGLPVYNMGFISKTNMKEILLINRINFKSEFSHV